MKVLKSVAWEEEKQRGPNQAMMMKVKYKFKALEKSNFTSVHLCLEMGERLPFCLTAKKAISKEITVKLDKVIA